MSTLLTIVLVIFFLRRQYTRGCSVFDLQVHDPREEFKLIFANPLALFLCIRDEKNTLAILSFNNIFLELIQEFALSIRHLRNIYKLLVTYANSTECCRRQNSGILYHYIISLSQMACN